LSFEPVDVPDFKNIMNNLENLIPQYQDLILKKLEQNDSELLASITKDLDTTDSIRCFFAVLFLARDEKVDLLQVDDDIRVTLIK
jgi:segregation and condensation protein A